MTSSNSPFRALLTLRNQTPLHAGILGGNHLVDNPIDRDVNTQIPKVSRTALKGALREQKIFSNESLILGSNVKEISQFNIPSAEGALYFTDLRLLFLPVRSKAGIWAWITCPRILQRFRQDTDLIWNDTELCEAFYQAFDYELSDKAAYSGEKLKIASKVVLQNYVFNVDNRVNTGFEAWQSSSPSLQSLPELKERLVVLSNDNFDFLATLSIETITRNKVNDELKAVADGALFTEEYLSSNALLYGLAFSSPTTAHSDILNHLKSFHSTIQLGSNATLGKGICELNWFFPLTQTDEL